MKKQHSEEYKKGYHDCACMLKHFVMRDSSKRLLLKYIARAINRNKPGNEADQEPRINED